MVPIPAMRGVVIDLECRKTDSLLGLLSPKRRTWLGSTDPAQVSERRVQSAQLCAGTVAAGSEHEQLVPTSCALSITVKVSLVNVSTAHCVVHLHDGWPL